MTNPPASFCPSHLHHRDVAPQSGHQPPANARQSELAGHAACSYVPKCPGGSSLPRPPACSGIKRGQTRWAGAGVGEEEEERGVTLDLGVSSCPRPERGTALRRADPAGTA